MGKGAAMESWVKLRLELSCVLFGAYLFPYCLSLCVTRVGRFFYNLEGE